MINQLPSTFDLNHFKLTRKNLSPYTECKTQTLKMIVWDYEFHFPTTLHIGESTTLGLLSPDQGTIQTFGWSCLPRPTF